MLWEASLVSLDFWEADDFFSRLSVVISGHSLRVYMIGTGSGPQSIGFYSNSTKSEFLFSSFFEFYFRDWYYVTYVNNFLFLVKLGALYRIKLFTFPLSECLRLEILSRFFILNFVYCVVSMLVPPMDRIRSCIYGDFDI